MQHRVKAGRLADVHNACRWVARLCCVQCAPPARKLLDMGGLPTLALSSWLLQVVLMGVGALTAAVKGWEAIR